MRFIVFGGGGDMGRRAAVELATTPGVEQITLVGRTLRPLEQAKEQLLAAQVRARSELEYALASDDTTRGNGAASAVQSRSGGDADVDGFAHIDLVVQDVSDEAAVQALMREYDVALGVLGPFYMFEELLVKSAIAAGTAYISICDDGDATTAALRHDEAARAAGVTILTGLGWTPGLTNLLVMRNAAMLERVTDVRISWAGSAAEADNGAAVILHTMHIFNGDVVTFADGRSQMVRAGTDSEIVTFPEPLGPVKVCHVGHPEPVTLPDYIPGVRTVALKGGVVEPALHTLSGLTGRLRLARTHGSRLFLRSMLKPMIPVLSRVGPRKPRLSGVVVEVDGAAKGAQAPVTLQSAAVGPMAALTSVPIAIGALWIAQGRIDRKGVFPPEAEGGPDPEAFLRALAERDIRVVHTMT